MSFDWKSLPEHSQAAYGDHDLGANEHAVHLGAPTEELMAARDGLALVVALSDRAWIRCSGSDAQSFLHNQLTSDINHLAIGTWQHSAWCTAKGRMLVSFLVNKNEQVGSSTVQPAFHLQLAGELVPTIFKRLKMYVLRSKVSVECADDLVSIGLAADTHRAGAILAAVSLPHPTIVGTCIDFPGGWVSRITERLLQINVSVDSAASMFAALAQHARPAGLTAWHWLEIQAGLTIIRQATQEEFVPQMVNFDKIGGVSFQKGCYPGQEIVARTQYLGKVKRHLFRVHSEGPLASGMPLHYSDADGAHSAGVIANAAVSPNGGFDALAVILESAVDGQVHAGQDGPVLSSIALVAA
jgi:tRNA-modifying protein YgfZ